MKDSLATSASTGQTWNTTAYAAHGRFVATLATGVVGLLNPQPGEHILDVGCGDGALTEQLASTGAVLTGVDASPTMVAAARARGLNIDHHSVESLPYKHQFDAVFSNAALHWIPAASQPTALAAIHQALRPGGRFVAEMGGHANIASIRVALQSVLTPYGIDAESSAASFYPSPDTYRRLLSAAGFTVQSIEIIPRPTPLPIGSHGEDPMATWLTTFRNGVLDRLPPADRAQAIKNTVALLEPVLCDTDGNWIADYVRLRFHAIA
ncbi:class I SAM-dependent methyltransferase [Granulicella sp. dw_53]|uniref:class I SAM-dependent methyltransferase n=1 Tax=Granulicella sp. dw_53 TaxID=2719792 RepID=UPI001BD240CC|nr:class I SAM-dependent methyltransferase [Granulicella sp. dw_53]